MTLCNTLVFNIIQVDKSRVVTVILIRPLHHDALFLVSRHLIYGIYIYLMLIYIFTHTPLLPCCGKRS